MNMRNIEEKDKNKPIRIGHIRVAITCDFMDDYGKVITEEPKYLERTTCNEDEIKHIVLQDEEYHKMVIDFLETAKEFYAEENNLKDYARFKVQPDETFNNIIRNMFERK